MSNEEEYEDELEEGQETSEEKTDETSEKEEEEKTDEDIIDADKTWRPAGYDDIEKLRPLSKPRRVPIIIDRKNKVFIELFLKDLTVDQQLTIEEAMLTVEQGGGKKRRKKDRSKQKMKINLKEYYRLCWEKSVVRTNPPHLKKWNEIRKFKAKSGVWDKIKDLLPDPYASEEDNEVPN